MWNDLVSILDTALDHALVLVAPAFWRSPAGCLALLLAATGLIVVAVARRLASRVEPPRYDGSITFAHPIRVKR